MFKRNFVYYLLFIILLSSCSSAPRNPGDIDIIRAQAEHWLETGNKEATRGNFENALLILTEAKRQAVLVDDISLIVRVCLSKGNVLLSMGRTDEAFSQWERAVFEAELLGDRELLAVSKIFLIRGNLTSGREPPQTVLSEVIRESANLRSNRIFIAFAWQTRGLALRQLGSFREAEDAFMRSLDIHQRERNLENAAFDWFSIASIRSLAGNTGGAIEALQNSIAFDRRIENSWGLASSYRAMGDVLRRAGRENEAVTAYLRARAIFTAMGNQYEAAQIDRRILAAN